MFGSVNVKSQKDDRRRKERLRVRVVYNTRPVHVLVCQNGILYFVYIWSFLLLFLKSSSFYYCIHGKRIYFIKAIWHCKKKKFHLCDNEAGEVTNGQVRECVVCLEQTASSITTSICMRHICHRMLRALQSFGHGHVFIFYNFRNVLSLSSCGHWSSCLRFYIMPHCSLKAQRPLMSTFIFPDVFQREAAKKSSLCLKHNHSYIFWKLARIWSSYQNLLICRSMKMVSKLDGDVQAAVVQLKYKWMLLWFFQVC